MNSKLLLLSFLLSLFFLKNNAQTTATQTGIAIQGIARDSNNTALTNSSVSLSFELYYKDASSTEVTIGSIETINLTTDAFGIFSHVLNNTEVNNSKFSKTSKKSFFNLKFFFKILVIIYIIIKIRKLEEENRYLSSMKSWSHLYI